MTRDWVDDEDLTREELLERFRSQPTAMTDTQRSAAESAWPVPAVYSWGTGSTYRPVEANVARSLQTTSR
jgi:hypothetical protein